MSRGPGHRQRALLSALDAAGPLNAIRVVPPGCPQFAAISLRRAARGLVASGRARAIYLRAPSVRGSAVPLLHLVPVDSPLYGDSWTRLSRRWVQPPPLDMLSLPARLQAPVISDLGGVEISVSTANRIAREYRESRAKVA